MEMMAGIVDSPGIQRAKSLGIRTTTEGIRPILDDPQIRIVFDSTGAKPHMEHAPLLEAGWKSSGRSHPGSDRPLCGACRKYRRSGRCSELEHGDLRRPGDSSHRPCNSSGGWSALCRDRGLHFEQERRAGDPPEHRRVYPYDRQGALCRRRRKEGARLSSF